MNTKYILNFDIDDLSDNFLKNFMSNIPVTSKEKVLKYLKRFSPCAFSTQPIIDRLSDKKVVDAENEYSDGTYSWYDTEIYYFEHSL